MFGEAYKSLKEIVDDHILDFIPDVDPKSSILYDAMKYSLIAGGKRIRPVLLLAFFQIASKHSMELSFAIPFAEAVEYIQTYSLIHDDLPAMDNDDYRRGMLTNHKVFGEDIAILAGDALLSSAHEIMYKDMLLYIDNNDYLKRKVKAASTIAKGTGVRGMVQGQIADVENEGKPCSAEMLDFIDSNKTAAFIEASVMAGCYLGGASSELKEDARCYGEYLGHAFQVVDDIMDVISTKEERGKDVGGDAELGKSTYPAVYGLEESKAIAFELLSKARKVINKYENNEVPISIINYLEGQIR